MSKVISEWKLDKYKMLEIDSDVPNIKPPYNVVIDGTSFNVIIPYDMKRAIGIQSEDTFIGKEIVFS